MWSQHGHGQRIWHPLTGAVVTAAVSLLVLPVAVAGGVTPGGLGVAGFLAMGGIAGFAVSGST